MSGLMQMSLFGSSFFDVLTGAIGAYFYMVVWNTIQASGLILVAFLAVIINAVKENYEEDDLNDNPHQQWGRVKVELIIMMFVVIFVGKPLIGITDFKIRSPTRQCEILPNVTTYTMNMTGEERQLLEIFGPIAATMEFIERERIETGIRNQQGLVNSVTRRMFQGDTWRHWVEFTRGKYNSNDQQTMARFIGAAHQNNKQFKSLQEVGLTLSTMKGIEVPLWWQLVRNFMLGFNAAVQTQIPCDDELKITEAFIDHIFISSPSLLHEFNGFVQQCHNPALALWRKHLTQKRRGDAGALMLASQTVAIPGNRVLLDITAYYPSLQAQEPILGFGVSPNEQGYTGDPNATGSANPDAGTSAGYPMCDKWWSDPVRGIESRLADDFGITSDPKVFNRFQRKYKSELANDSDGRSAMVQLVLADKLTSNSKASYEAKLAFLERNNAIYTGHDSTRESNNAGSQLLGVATDLGLITSYIERAAGFKGILRAAPLGTAVLIMLITAMLPIGLILGRFGLNAVMSLTIFLFSVYLWLPYFRIVRWLDDNLVSIIGYDILNTDKLLIDIVIAVGYMAVPMVIGGIATMVGIRIASMDPIGTSTVGSIAQQGAKTAQNAAKWVASKGISKGK
ncbi:conjugal transfer protein TraG N-terminal domain-containing protein [Vibrio vulnificus]